MSESPLPAITKALNYVYDGDMRSSPVWEAGREELVRVVAALQAARRVDYWCNGWTDDSADLAEADFKRLREALKEIGF